MGWDVAASGLVASATAESVNGHRYVDSNGLGAGLHSSSAPASVPSFIASASGSNELAYQQEKQLQSATMEQYMSPRNHPQHRQQASYRIDTQQYEPQQQQQQQYAFSQQASSDVLPSSYLGGGANARAFSSANHLQSPHRRMEQSNNGFAYGQNTAFQNPNFVAPQNTMSQQFAPFFQQQQQQFQQQQLFVYAGGQNHAQYVQTATYSPNISQRMAKHPTSAMVQMQVQHYQQQQQQPAQQHPFFAQPQNGYGHHDRPIQARLAIERPLMRLSVSLIDAYRNINRVYYEDRNAKRAEREAHQAVAQQQQQVSGYRGMSQQQQQQQQQPPPWDDEHYDYIIREGEVFYDRYIIQERIGRGSFGQVIRARDTVTKRDVAIKIIKSKKPFRIQAQTEIELLSSLCEMDPEDQHNIVRLESHFMFRNHQCLVFELLSLNLYDLLRNTQFSGVSLNLIRKFAKQILKALHFLSKPELNIIHCDLKPENILLRHPKRSGIKVVDFGSSCRSNRQTYSYIQSRFYRSPEVMLGLPYSVAIDMWSLGCILVEMHTGEPLFSGSDQFDQMSRIVEVLGMVPTNMIDRSTAKYRDIFFERTVDHFGLQFWVMRRPPDQRSEIIPSANPLASLSAKVRAGTNRRRSYDPSSQADIGRTYELFEDLVSRMLTFDPQQRIKPMEALRHPFLFEAEQIVHRPGGSSIDGAGSIVHG